MNYKVYHNISGSLTVNITTVTNITLTGVLAGYTYIITVVPVNILGDGYPNKTIGYLNNIIKCVMFTSHTVIIPKEPVITGTSTSVIIPDEESSITSTCVVTTSFNETTTVVVTSDRSIISKYNMVIIFYY